MKTWSVWQVYHNGLKNTTIYTEKDRHTTCITWPFWLFEDKPFYFQHLPPCSERASRSLKFTMTTEFNSLNHSDWLHKSQTMTLSRPRIGRASVRWGAAFKRRRCLTAGWAGHFQSDEHWTGKWLPWKLAYKRLLLVLWRLYFTTARLKSAHLWFYSIPSFCLYLLSLALSDLGAPLLHFFL